MALVMVGDDLSFIIKPCEAELSVPCLDSVKNQEVPIIVTGVWSGEVRVQDVTTIRPCDLMIMTMIGGRGSTHSRPTTGITGRPMRDVAPFAVVSHGQWGWDVDPRVFWRTL